MKKHFFYPIAIAIVSVVFVSCNKDESMLELLEQETATVNELTSTEEFDEGDDRTENEDKNTLSGCWPKTWKVQKSEGVNVELKVIEFQDGDDLTLRKRLGYKIR